MELTVQYVSRLNGHQSRTLRVELIAWFQCQYVSCLRLSFGDHPEVLMADLTAEIMQNRASDLLLNGLHLH